MGSMIDVKSTDGFTLKAYHAAATGKRKGGLILIQEIFGLSPSILHAANKFAGLGFEVIAPSMFDRVAPGFSSEDHSMDSITKAVGYAQSNGMDAPVMDVTACFERLKAQGPVCITGYCYGGSIAFLAACKVKGLAASAAYYGSLVPQFAAEKPLCPTIAHFGRNDPFIPMDQVEQVKKARPDMLVYVYEAGHGFAREGSEDYHAESDRLALERTLAVFAEGGAI